MRRKECMEWPPCLPPGTAGVRNKEDYRHTKPYIYYQARSQIIMSQGHDVLNIDIFNGFALGARYFADRKTGSHTALIMATGEWKGTILQNVVNTLAGMKPDFQNEGLYYYCGCREYEKYTYASEEDKERVKNYFKDTRGLAAWEAELQRQRREKQLSNKADRINARLDYLIPPIPEDFYRWMHEEVFGRKYLFQHKEDGETSCTCSACKRTWKQKKAAGVGTKICPKCGASARGTYRKEEKDNATLFLLQPCRDGLSWTERVFEAYCTWKPGEESFVNLDERIRYIVKNGESWGECFYEDGCLPDGRTSFWDTNHYSFRAKSGYLYPGSVSECAGSWPPKLANAGLQLLASRMAKANYNNIITTWHKKPWFEYLAKGGFDELIRELSTSIYAEGRKSGRLNDRGRNTQEVFRLDAGRICRLKQTGEGFKALNWLQYEHSMQVKISEENMKFLVKHFWPDADTVVKALDCLGSPNIFANYFRKQSAMMKVSPQSALEEYIDYLDMASKQGLNLCHEMFYKPKNLKEAHDACVREAQMEEGRKRAEKILKKFPDVEKNMDEVRSKYSYEGETFSILVPNGIPDIIHEGRALGHCIDSTDRYFDRINQKITYLVFLRRTSEKSAPWYTLEIEPGGTIRQQRTTGNNQNKADLEEYASFIREWQGAVRERLTKEDQELAGRSREIRIQEYRDLREKEEKVWHGKMAGTLLADLLEADLIESVG